METLTFSSELVYKNYCLGGGFLRKNGFFLILSYKLDDFYMYKITHSSTLQWCYYHLCRYLSLAVSKVWKLISLPTGCMPECQYVSAWLAVAAANWHVQHCPPPHCQRLSTYLPVTTCHTPQMCIVAECPTKPIDGESVLFIFESLGVTCSSTQYHFQ